MRIKRNNVDEEIPTSSMADIAFLLIIYFMVTTTFAATRGIDFSLPQEEDTPLVDKGRVGPYRDPAWWGPCVDQQGHATRGNSRLFEAQARTQSDEASHYSSRRNDRVRLYGRCVRRDTQAPDKIGMRGQERVDTDTT